MQPEINLLKEQVAELLPILKGTTHYSADDKSALQCRVFKLYDDLREMVRLQALQRAGITPSQPTSVFDYVDEDDGEESDESDDEESLAEDDKPAEDDKLAAAHNTSPVGTIERSNKRNFGGGAGLCATGRVLRPSLSAALHRVQLQGKEPRHAGGRSRRNGEAFLF